MSSTEQLDRAAVDFLLRAMEAPHLQVTAAALSLHPSSLSDALLKYGYLVPDGYEAVLTSPDLQDRLVQLVWSEDSEGFRYFDAAEGWVKVSHEEVRRYRIDVDRVISSLTSLFGITPARRILVESILWDLGARRFGNRTKMMPILFARRMSQPTSTKLVQRALQTRPLNGVPLLLTSTPWEDLPPFSAAHVISIRDILENGLALDPNKVAASLDRSISARPSDPIILLAGGKEVVFFGRSYSFAKGTQQRRILRLLYDHYRQGEHSLSVEYVIVELELRPNARIRDFFKKHPAWGVMLFEKGGKCGFVLDTT